MYEYMYNSVIALTYRVSYGPPVIHTEFWGPEGEVAGFF